MPILLFVVPRDATSRRNASTGGAGGIALAPTPDDVLSLLCMVMICRQNRRTVRLHQLAALAVAVAWPAMAQKPPPTQQFEEHVAVEMVTVDMVVTDRKGRPVTGLTKEDFAVFEDGRPMTLTHFQGPAEDPGEPSDTSAVETLSAETTEPSPAEDRQPFHFVLYFDDYSLEPSHRARILADLRTFVTQRLPRDARVMVIQHRPGIQVAAPFTIDGAQIAAALEDVERSKPTARAIDLFGEGRRVLQDIASIYQTYENVRSCEEPCDEDGCAWPLMRARAEQYARDSLAWIGRNLDGLGTVIANLAGVSGRKVVLYVGDGFPRQPGLEVFHFLGELCPQRVLETSFVPFSYDATSAIERVTAHANANRVTLYTLEGAGLRSHSTASTEFGDRRFTPSALNDGLQIANLQSSLFQLAVQTGGDAILNTNLPASPLERMGAELVQTYSLAYRADHPPEGKSHRLRVELADKKQGRLELRYRHSYRHKTEEDRLGERLLAALELGMEENPLGVEVKAEAGEPAGKGTIRVPVHISVPSEALHAGPGKEAGDRRLRVFLVAADALGRRTTVRQRLMSMETPADADGMRPRHDLVVRIELPSGEHRIAVGVRDEVTAVTSYVLADVQVGVPPPATHE